MIGLQVWHCIGEQRENLETIENQWKWRDNVHRKPYMTQNFGFEMHGEVWDIGIEVSATKLINETFTNMEQSSMLGH